jgi:hypothetical protein
VDGAALLLRHPDMIKAIAAQAGHVRLRDAQRQGDGRGGIGSIAAGTQHAHSGFGGCRMVAGDGGAAPHDQRAVATTMRIQ